MMSRRAFVWMLATLPAGGLLWRWLVSWLRPAAYLVEAKMGEEGPSYRLTIDEDEATHGLIDVSGRGDWQIVPLAQVDGSVRLVRTSADGTYLGY